MKKSMLLLILFLALTVFSASVYTAVYAANYSPFDEKKLKGTLRPELEKRFGKVSELTIARHSFFHGKYYVVYFFKCNVPPAPEPADFVAMCEVEAAGDGKYTIMQDNTRRTAVKSEIELIWLYDSETGAFVEGGRAKNTKLTQIKLHTIRGDSSLADISEDRGFIAVFPEGEGLCGNPAAYAAGHDDIRFHSPELAHIRMLDSVSGLGEGGCVLEEIRIYY